MAPTLFPLPPQNRPEAGRAASDYAMSARRRRKAVTLAKRWRAHWRFCVEASCSPLSEPSTRSKAPRSIMSTVESVVAVTVAARLSAESSASSPAEVARGCGRPNDAGRGIPAGWQRSR